jgi:hypothetical protein
MVVQQCGDLPAELRLLRCTNAGFQERRASAHRGNETHLQCRGFFSGREYVRLPRLAYTSRSWLHLRLSLQTCVFQRQACQCFPRLAYASRSWCTASVDRKITTLAVHKRTFCTSGGRQPAVGGQNRIRTHDRYSSAGRRRCVYGLPLHSRF